MHKGVEENAGKDDGPSDEGVPRWHFAEEDPHIEDADDRLKRSDEGTLCGRNVPGSPTDGELGEGDDQRAEEEQREELVHRYRDPHTGKEEGGDGAEKTSHRADGDPVEVGVPP